MQSAGLSFSDVRAEKNKPSDLESAIQCVMDSMARHGNLKFVKNVILRFQAGIQRGDERDLDAWGKAVTATSQELTPGARRK